MVNRFIKFLVIIFVLLPGVYSLHACSAFCLADSNSVLVAKNYDWNINFGLIIINMRNVAKVAIAEVNPVSWISRYGSITFNQYGREMPNGGMNEAGLVIEVLWLNGTEYPAPDNRYAIGTLQWIQYQLDNNSTIEEVIVTDTLIQIDGKDDAEVHYFVCDYRGECAVIEFIDGQMVCHSGDDLPVKAITNNTYNESMEFISRYEGFGGQKTVDERDKTVEVFSREASLDRFLHSAKRTKEFKASNSNENVEYAFNSLDLVRSDDMTVWRIVYEVGNRIIHFRSAASNGHKFVSFAAFDFACSTPVKILDINHPGSGDVVANFSDYSEEINYSYIKAAFNNTYFLQNIPEESLRALAAYPSYLQCIK